MPSLSPSSAADIKSMRTKRPRKNAQSREKRQHVGLGDIARFRIRSVRPTSGEKVELEGEFSHLAGVRLSDDTEGTVGFLYVSRKDSIHLLWKRFDPRSKSATFLVWPQAKAIRVGDSYPYVDNYWDPKQVSFALESASAWRRVLFKAEDSVRYRDPAVPGYWKSHVANAAVSEGATDVHIIKNGWDHEHCHLCHSRIGRGGGRYGYFSKADNDWLCVRCYKKFIAAHDLRYLQFKK